MLVKKPPAAASEGESIDSLIERCDQLIERLNHLYRMYVNGVEKHPPREVRAQLDALMARLAQAKKTKVDAKFKYQTVSEKYSLYSQRWERMLRGLEKGR